MKNVAAREAKTLNNMKKSIKRVFWLIALMFFVILCTLAKITLLDRNKIATNGYNPRLNYSDSSIKRGTIKDSNGQVIAESKKNEDDFYSRVYPRARMAAHITGYSSVGKTGIESAENFELEKVHNEILQRIKNLANGSEICGNNVVLTLDMDIQSVAGNLLGDKKGAVVAIEPSTGKVLALQAYPDFDPNTVQQNWDSLREDEDSPLLNRATNGLYPPGSTFKIVTAAAAMEFMPDWESFVYDCKGEAEFDGKIIHCYNNTVHGQVDMKKAMAVSCNCYFSELAKKIGAGKLREVAERLYFNQSYPFLLGLSQSKVALTQDSSESELVETAIGQGKTVATPLHMAMLASAVANGGVMMQPYIVDHIEYSNGKSSHVTMPEQINTIFSVEETSKLKEMMLEAVESGTGTAAQISGVVVAGKTGTAENATGNDHSWFIGFAPADSPKVAVAVILENADKNSKAAPIAGKVMKAVLDKYN